MNRKRAMQLDLPDDWHPSVGDTVYVRPIQGTMGRLLSKGTIAGTTLTDDFFKVRFQYGRQVSSSLWCIEDLRPVSQ